MPEENILPKEKKKSLWARMGPGLVTGASDDDPSGIATYTQAGASFGYGFLWTALATWPLMVSVQNMCASIGLVTGKGLGGIIRDHFPKPVLYLVMLITFPGILLNIGADIAAMGEVTNMLVPAIPSSFWSVMFALLIMYFFIFWNYRKITETLKWLCISLFAYIIIPFLSDTQWLDVFNASIVPHLSMNADSLMMLTAILGTTISPYLFFWQTSIEAEEKKHRRLIVDKQIISDAATETGMGMAFTNIVFYSIILSAAVVLNPAHISNIETVDQAAMALRPLAGEAAGWLFSLGVIGTGALAIPVLAGSMSYFMSEVFNWKSGLDEKFSQARPFYFTMMLSLCIGLLLPMFDISPLKALVYTAVLYGMISPVLILILLSISNNKTIMEKYTNPFMTNIGGIAALLLMSASAVLTLYFTFLR
jgi:NRAMP (natural resistance-associated macrophage protein)-like metal ion transporter